VKSAQTPRKARGSAGRREQASARSVATLPRLQGRQGMLMQQERTHGSTTRKLGAALGLALWTGGMLLVGRVAILFALEHFRRAEETRAAFWRIAQTLPPIAVHVLAAGALAALITVLLVQRR